MQKCDRCGKEVAEFEAIDVWDDGPWPKGHQGQGEKRSEEQWCWDCILEENLEDCFGLEH